MLESEVLSRLQEDSSMDTEQSTDLTRTGSPAPQHRARHRCPEQKQCWESYTEGRRRRKMCPVEHHTQSTRHSHQSTPHAHVLPSSSKRFRHCTYYRKLPGSLTSLLAYLITLVALLNSRDVYGNQLGNNALRQKFANQPSPQTAVIGSTVVLPCRVINMVGELQWTRDDFGLGNERELTAFKRYKMIGSHEEGDYSLRISPVTLEDDAKFQCQVTGAGSVSGVRSQSAKLSVYVPPERPDILQGPVVTTTAGAGVQIECISRGGKPAADIQWLDGSGREFRVGVEYTTDLLEDNHRQDAKSTLSFVATKEHHNAILTCTASNPAINQPLSTQVRLEVSYPPEVTISHASSGYKEGDTATLSCHASANPALLTFRWYRGGQLVSNENSTQLVLENVSRENNLEDITCEVSNDVGSSRKITRLNVHYGPSFLSEPDDVFADPGENVSLHCDVDANPEAKIVWMGQQEQTVFGRGPIFSLEATPKTVGNYLCIAKVDGFQEISGAVGLFLKGPPGVQAEASQWGQTGDTVSMVCHVTSASPRSVTVTWSKYGSKVDLEPGRFEEVEELTAQGLRHSLVIHNAKPEDFGTYNCSVQNAFGSGMVEIVLNKRKGLPLLLIIAGAGLGIVLVLAFAVGAVLYGKKSTAKQRAAKGNGGLPEKTVTLQLGDQSSNGNDSDLKVELENRTGSSLSNCKEPVELDGWDKDAISTGGSGGPIMGGTARQLPPIVSSPNNAPTPPSYHLTTSSPSYLYTEGYSRMSLKQNGHVMSNGGALSYGNYVDHSTLGGQKPGVITSGFSSVGLTSGYSTAGPTYSQGPLVTSSQHNIFPSYGDYDLSRENIDGSPSFTHNYPNGYSTHGLGCSTLPLGLHLTSRNNMNSNSGPPPPVPNPPTTSSINEHISGTASPSSATIPRLGIPVDPSQYIMPPRTQVMQGALATHV
uniref:Irregular chiasm C-roughest protein-like n=1 Tax=Hirondellea gigas TaxID=1518452 RepID=A0A6A7FVC0_9CRUS